MPDSLTDDILWLVCNRDFEDFRAIVVAAPARADRFPLLPYAAEALRRRRRRHRARGAAVAGATGDAIAMPEFNFDGIPGPTHNYSGLAHGNLASEHNAELGRQSARSGAAGPRQDARARRARLSAGGAAAARAAVPAGAARAGLRRQRRATCSRAPRATRRRCSPHARRPRRCGSPTPPPSARRADTRRRPRAFHARQPRRRISIARSKRRRRRACCARSSPTRRASSCTIRCRPRRNSATKARPTTRASPPARRRPASSSSSTAGAASAAARRRRAFPARQTREASRGDRAAARPRRRRARCSRSRIREAIDAGVFHNDVIAVGQRQRRCSATSARIVDQHAVLAELARARRRRHSRRSSCATHDVSVDDAVATYLFNSQLLARPDGAHAARRARRVPRASARRRVSRSRCVASGGPIAEVLTFDLRQSMRNGGGPACLRLRVRADRRRARGGRRERLPRRRARATRSTRGSRATIATGSRPPISPTRRCSTNRGARWTS